jgi:cytosine/uracil/thiamine/allantoin permease
MSIGFTAREVIPLTFAGFLICGFVVSLTGKIAATYHVPFPVIVRSSLYVPVSPSHSLIAYYLLFQVECGVAYP